MSIKDVKRVYNQLEVHSSLSLVQQSNDTLVTSKVKSMMLATKKLHSTQIKVVTENKVVYLMGIVTRVQASLAASTASHITGVSKVVEVFEYEE
jgi:osmotically-inducible protein OsmY